MIVKEEALLLGYFNLSHFSNSFKSYYGASPIEFVQKQEKASKS